MITINNDQPFYVPCVRVDNEARIPADGIPLSRDYNDAISVMQYLLENFPDHNKEDYVIAQVTLNLIDCVECPAVLEQRTPGGFRKEGNIIYMFEED